MKSNDNDAKIMLLKRRLKELKAYKGQGTQLISLYVPRNADRSSVTKQLSDEISQSSNIKSSQTRKNVQSALRRIINYLKQIDFKIPENGLVLFSGNVSTNPAKTDVILLDLVPPKPLATKLYWCDSSFHTAPLDEMCVTDEVYGLIAIDKREATIALLSGKNYQIIAHETSGVPGKTRAGGQCLKDSLVMLSNGNILDIDIIESNKLKSLDIQEKKIKESSVLKKWSVKKEKLFKIFTRNPKFEITSSEDHIFYVFDGKIKTKLAKELSTKDYLLFANQINITGKSFNLKFKRYKNIKLPNKLNRKLSLLLGYILGCGRFKNNKIYFLKTNKKLEKKYKIISKSFNINLISKNKNLYLDSVEFFEFISNEFPKLFNYRVPSKILMSDNKIISYFLSGLFDAVGSFNLENNTINFMLNNIKESIEIQLLFLRYSIFSSLSYNKIKKKNSLEICEYKSINLFMKNIRFSDINFRFNLVKLKKEKKDYRKLLVDGRNVKKIIENTAGLNINRFKDLSEFFENKHLISKTEFKNRILNRISKKSIYNKLKKIIEYEVSPVRVGKIIKIKKSSKMTDLSVSRKNFIANGLIVHNSAHRFERLREKAAESFYKRVGEKVNSAYVNLEKLKGIIIGGPGNTKNSFIERGSIDHRIKNKILGTVDVGYTDESGIKEILYKAAPILKDVGIIKEKNLVNKFITEVAKDSLATYGFKNIISAMNSGKVSTLLVSEALNWTIVKFKCVSCNRIIPKLVKTKELKESDLMPIACTFCNSKTELVEYVDLFDYFLDLGEKTNVKVELISTETQEGAQFYDTFGGLGAILRYK